MAKSNRRAFLTKGPASRWRRGRVRGRDGAGPGRRQAGQEGALDGRQAAREDAALQRRRRPYGNLVFISGIGAHFEGDIKAHTEARARRDPEEARSGSARRWRRC